MYSGLLKTALHLRINYPYVPIYENIIWFLKIIQPQIANSYVHQKHSKPTKSQNPKQEDKVSLQGGTS